MSILFEPARIKNMELRNRLVRSATYDGSAEVNGHVSDKQIELFSNLAKGGAGLIVTGIAYVHQTGQVSAFMNSIADDACIAGFQKITKIAHEHEGKICVQLFHGGREARYLKTRNQLPLAPSVLDNDPFFKGYNREITEDEIGELIQSFGAAARRAQEAGFDGVQVHGAHAYLFSQFLSSHTNRRQDNWGGTLENRLRFHKEVYKSIRAKVGNTYPVMIKIGVCDGFNGGLGLEEGIEAAVMMASTGFDALEISSALRGERYAGTEFKAGITTVDKEAYFRDWCRTIKGRIDVPLIMVGGLRTFTLMEEIVRNGEADFVALCRPLIREPGIINEWRSDKNRKAACISCNRCYEALYRGVSLRCIVEEESPCS
jgi:2,4-dienoyl-CoA reductase-like NADH-dependent reductase (Old Yellow Enzyme family)